MADTELLAAKKLLRLHLSKHRLLLVFCPRGNGEGLLNKRSRDKGDLSDIDVPPYDPGGLLSWDQYDRRLLGLTEEKGGVDYAQEYDKRDLRFVFLDRPSQVRPPTPRRLRDWDVVDTTLDEEMGLRRHFAIGDQDEKALLISKHGKVIGHFAPPVWIDDVLTYIGAIAESDCLWFKRRWAVILLATILILGFMVSHGVITP